MNYLVFMNDKEIVGMVAVEEDFDPEPELVATANTLGHRMGLLENFEAPDDNPISEEVLLEGHFLLDIIEQTHRRGLAAEASQ